MASVKPAIYEVRPEGEGFALYRDGEILRTPRNLPVAVASRALADALLDECRAQRPRLDLRKMPMMQMVLTAIDITAAKRGEIVDGIMRFGENELLCLRADDPPELAAAQDAAWKPWLDWARETFGATLHVAAGIAPPTQDAGELGKLRAVVEITDDNRLTALSEAVGISGSLVLGLALLHGQADAHAVMLASEHDGIWQMKKWGEDADTLARQADIERELGYCARWLELTA